MKSTQGRTVLVQDGNIDKALRKFKKKVAAAGILMELQERQSYTKPNVKRKVAKAMAKKRWKKHLQKQQLPPKQY